MKKGFIVTFLTALLLWANLPSAHAVVLDWDSVSWAAGSLGPHSYDIDGIPGNDITVTITPSGANSFIPISGQPTNSPQIYNDLTGGITPVENSLRLQVDLANKTSYVMVTIDFLNPAGVLNPTFSIYDIDTGANGTSYVDEIRNIQATFGATTYLPTLTTGSAVTASGGNTLTGNANVANNGTTAADGTGTISFNGGPVTQITFLYGSGSAAQANPAQQGVGIADISYNNISGVPEVNTVWILIVALLAAGFFHTFRQRQARCLSTRAPVE